jgi:hypothetical protein
LEDNLHKVNIHWRAAEINSLETRAIAINEWLDHTEDLVRMFDNNNAITSALRGVAGTMRTQRNDLDTAAGKLRAELESLENQDGRPK